jgi:hypothetical protein
MAKNAKVAKANVIPRGKHGISTKAASAKATKAKAKASAKAKVSAKATAKAKVSAKAKAKAKAKVPAKAKAKVPAKAKAKVPAKAKAKAKVSAKAKAAKGLIQYIIKAQVNQTHLVDSAEMWVDGDLCMVDASWFNKQIEKPRVYKKLEKMKNNLVDSEAWKARCPDNKAMEMLLQGFEATCDHCRQAQDLFTDARENYPHCVRIGSIPQLMKAAVALKGSILKENCQAMASIIYDPDQKPVAVADVKDMLLDTVPKMTQLLEKSEEIRSLLKMHNRQLAAEEKVG